jgi:hypothetical protein
MVKGVKIFLWVLLAAAVLAFMIPMVMDMPAVRDFQLRSYGLSFEPHQLVFTNTGVQTMTVSNGGDCGLVVDFRWKVSPVGAAGVYTNQKVYLIPGEEREVEVDVNLYEGIPVTITPEVGFCYKALRLPGEEKIGVPSLTLPSGSAPPGQEYLTPQLSVYCYYVNELSRPSWISIHPRLEPDPDDLYVAVESGETPEKIEPGQAHWYEVAIKPSQWGSTSRSQRVSLVVDVDELPWTTEDLEPFERDMQQYLEWAQERGGTPTEYPVALTFCVEKPEMIEFQEFYINNFSCPLRLDAGETFSKTLHFLNKGPSREIKITASVLNMAQDRPDIPIEVSLVPEQQIFWYQKVTSVELKIRVPDIELDRNAEGNILLYHDYWNHVTLALKVITNVSD